MSKKRNIFIFILVLGTISLSAKTAQRIVSLAPSITKNLYFLGAQSNLIGCTSYCTEALADNKEVVASAISVNLEKTISLKPDLVLATTITNPETLEKLKQFGIQVEIFPTPVSFAEICQQFQHLGKLTSKTEIADQITVNSQAKINELKSAISKEYQPEVFFQIGTEPLFTVLENTFMNDYITFAGGKNIARGLTKGTMTRENVMVKNPEYIFVVTMGIIGEEEIKNWSKYHGLKAADKHNIFEINAEKACSPTPITFVETMEVIVKLMNRKNVR